MSKRTLVAAASIAVLSFATAGLSLAQSGSRPSGTQRPEPAAEVPAAARTPKVIGLVFYADWCPGCKELKPKLETVMKSARKDSCLFVKLDQTDKQSRQAEYLLAALGLGELWKENGGHTGYALLVDTESSRVVGRFDPGQSTDSMKAALASALGS